MKEGAAPDVARSIVADARRRITLAADFSRDQKLKEAVERLDGLYTAALDGKDLRTAIQAQKELNRIFSLYSGGKKHDPTDPTADDNRRKLDLIATYVLPLKLAAESYPIEEHVRIAAETIRRGHLPAKARPRKG